MLWFVATGLLLAPLACALETVTVCRNTFSSGFLIQVIPFTSAVAKRQDSVGSGYLDQNGVIVRNCQQGSTWRLENAQLSSSGGKVSAPQNVASSRFSVSPLLQAINTKFATTDDFLFWDNAAFQDGTARFCITSGFNGTLNAVFGGGIGIGCTQANLRTVPLSSCNRQSPSTNTASTASASSSPAVITPGTSFSEPFITGVPAPSQNSSSSFSAPFITGVPAPSQNSSSSFSAPFITGVPAPSQNSSLSFSTIFRTSTAIPAPSQNSSSSSALESTPSQSTTPATLSHSSYTGRPTFLTGAEYGSLGSSSPSGMPTPSQNISTTAVSSAFSPSANSSSSISLFSTSSYTGRPTFSTGAEYGSLGSSSPSGIPKPSQNSSTTAISRAFSQSANSSSSISSVRTHTNSTSASASFTKSNSTATLLPTASHSNATSAGFPTVTSNATSTSARIPTSSANSTSSLNATSISNRTSSGISTSTITSSHSIPPFIFPSITGPNRIYTTYCSSFLGYSHFSQATVTIDETVLETSVSTAIPPVETMIDVSKTTKSSTTVVPFESTTIEVTPIVSMGFTVTAIRNATETQTVIETSNDYSQYIQKRQATQGISNMTMPAGLQSAAPNIISSFCSLIVASPTSLPIITVTRISTEEEVRGLTASPSLLTINVSSEYDIGVTITSGDFRTTVTEEKQTHRFTTTITTTQTLNATVTVTSTNTIPTVILAHPTAIIGSVNGSISDYDDFAYNLTLPFPLSMYDYSSPHIWVSTNGLLSLDHGSWYYNNAPLPRQPPIPNYTIFPFWDDTYIYKGQPQGIYYEVTGGGSGTRVAFEFYLSHYHGSDQYYHYTVGYDEADPGVYVVKYYQVLDNGTSATVGMQDFNAYLFTQYSYNTPDIYPGLELTFNTNTGVITDSTFDVMGNQTTNTG